MAAAKTKAPGKPHGPMAQRFTVSQEARDWFAGRGAGQDRAWKIEDAILAVVSEGWARDGIPLDRVRAKVPDASVAEVSEAGRVLTREHRVYISGGKAYRTDKSGVAHSIPWTEVTSSNVRAVGYYASRRKETKSVLGVQFLSGTTYYYDCPLEYAKRMLASESKGKFLHWQIKAKNIPYAGPY